MISLNHAPSLPRIDVLDRRVLLFYSPPVATFGGGLDPTFGDGGWVTDLPLGHEADVREMLPDGSGGVFLVGDARLDQNVRDFALWRLAADGSPDLSFGTGGAVTTDFRIDVNEPESDDRVAAAVLQPDGTILAVGARQRQSSGTLALARYHPDGSLDGTFGNAGKVRVESVGWGNDVVLLPDGAILVAASAVDFLENAGHLVRFGPDGQLDASFGNGGIITNADFYRGPTALALQPDGQILAGGATIRGGSPLASAARYNPDGSRDIGFGDSGLFRQTYPNIIGVGAVRDVVIAPDGKILLSHGGVMRLSESGQVDSSFGEDGQAKPIRGYVTAERVALLPDGRILTAGSRNYYFAPDQSDSLEFVVNKIDSTGTMARHFAELGTAQVAAPNRDDVLTAMLVLPDGHVLLAGSAGGSAAVARVFSGYPALQDCTLAVCGTERGDSIHVARDGPELIVTLNEQAQRYPLDEIDRVYVLAGSGPDTVTLANGIGALDLYVDGEHDRDTLTGGDGDDTLCGGWGNDLLIGGPGNDRLVGAGGYDTLFGEAGNDRLYGGRNGDTLDGGLGRDRLWGGYGNGLPSGHDLLRGQSHNDSLWGEDGDDTLHGGYHDDLLDGGGFDDFLNGYFGRDTLIGGAGSDIIYSRDAATDTVIGGDGTDRARADAEDELDSIEALLA